MVAVALTLGVTYTSVIGAGGVSSARTRPVAPRVHSLSGVHASLLFVASATSGTLVRQGGSTTYALTLGGLDRNVVWFTDHPARQAGTEPATAFVQDWSAYGFAADPPNAALVLDAAHPGGDTAVGALSSPTFDPGTDSLRVDFTVYGGQQLKQVTGDLADKARRARGSALPADFGGASLFVDDAWEPTVNATMFPQQIATYASPTLIGSGVPVSFGPGLWAFGSVQGSFAGSTFTGPIEFTAPSLSGVDLSDSTQSGSAAISFAVVDFTGADLAGAVLPDATFLPGVDFDGADLQGAQLGQVKDPVTDSATTCTDGRPGPCNGAGLASG